MTKSIRDLVGGEPSREFSDLVENKLAGTEVYGYAAKGASPALPQFDEDPHGDRSDYYGETERVTVSEFIRQAKADWDHVATTEKRSSTLPFSGVPVMTITDPRTYEEQMDQFNRQVLGVDDVTPCPNISNSKDVEYVEVDDETEMERLERMNRKLLGLDS